MEINLNYSFVDISVDKKLSQMFGFTDGYKDNLWQWMD